MFAGVPTLPSPLQYDFARRTLTCISSGGPVTTAIWTREDNRPFQSTQKEELINIETATYHNLLTITGNNIRDYSGRYICRVGNDRGSSFTRSLFINGELWQNHFSHNIYSYLDSSIATGIFGDRQYELGETTSITCSTPVPVQSIQWVNVSTRSIIGSPELSILIDPSSEGMMYRCDIRDGSFRESETITIQVGSKYD